MANIQKYKASQVNGLLEHNARTDETRPHNHRNEDIDPTRTKDNYELHSTEGKAQQRHKARMSELHCMQRDDVTVLDSLMVTLPPDVKPEDERKFFESCYAFACGDYGKENIINATVHKDETTPHIHIGFIPVVEDTIKRGEHKGETVEKVRHSALITRTYLDTMHDRLSAHVAKDLGYEVSIINGSTAGRNKKTSELKAERAEKRAEKAEERASAAEQRAEQAEQRAEQAESRATEAESYLVNLLDGVPPLKVEPYPPKKALPEKYQPQNEPINSYPNYSRKYRNFDKELEKWRKGRDKEQDKINKEYDEICAEVDRRNEQARSEWESKYLTPDNISKAKAMVESQREQIQPTLARARAAEQAAASDRAKAKAEKEQAEKERQMHSESVRNEALRLTREREAELFGRDGKSRTERLESFCEGVRYENGESVLDRFEQQEDERRQEYRQTSFRGR